MEISLENIVDVEIEASRINSPVSIRVHHQFVIKLRKTQYHRASPLTYGTQYPHFLSISNTSVTEHHSFEALLFVHVQ